MRIPLLAAGAASLGLLLASVPTHAAIHLSFGLYTSNKPTSMVKQFRPVLDLMEDSMAEILDEPVEIRMQVAKDYSQGIEHLASGKVDFSRFGPASYIEAKRANAGLRILAMEREGGDKVFYGIIAVAEDSPISSVEDLRGRSFAFGNDQSTIGRYLSQQFLRNHGIFSSDLSRFDYLGRHDTVGTAVGAGHFEAGALNESTFTKLVGKGVPIRELARFPNVIKPWIAREGLPERLFSALRQALLGLQDPILQTTLKVDGFVPGGDQDFEDIRAAIEKNSVFFEGPDAMASTADQPAAAAPAASGSTSTTSQASEATATDSSPAAAPEQPAVTAPAAPESASSASQASEATASGSSLTPSPEQPAEAAPAASESASTASQAPEATATGSSSAPSSDNEMGVARLDASGEATTVPASETETPVIQ